MGYVRSYHYYMDAGPANTQRALTPLCTRGAAPIVRDRRVGTRRWVARAHFYGSLNFLFLHFDFLIIVISKHFHVCD